MTAQTKIIVPDEMREEIEQVVLDHAGPARPVRSALFRRLNDQSLGRKLALLSGVPLAALAAIAGLAWVALGTNDPGTAASLRWVIVAVTAVLIVLGIVAIRLVLAGTSNALRKLAGDMTALAAGENGTPRDPGAAAARRAGVAPGLGRRGYVVRV